MSVNIISHNLTEKKTCDHYQKKENVYRTTGPSLKRLRARLAAPPCLCAATAKKVSLCEVDTQNQRLNQYCFQENGEE